MKKIVENGLIILLTVLVAVVCYQGWLIKECREQLTATQQTVSELVKAQSDTVAVIHSIISYFKP